MRAKFSCAGVEVRCVFLRPPQTWCFWNAQILRSRMNLLWGHSEYSKLKICRDYGPKKRSMWGENWPKFDWKWSKSLDISRISSKICSKMTKFSEVGTDRSIFSRWKGCRSMENHQVYTRIEEIIEIGPNLVAMKAKWGQNWSKSYDFRDIFRP